MEGTWGRRIHGRVHEDKEEGLTRFCLVMLMDSTTFFSSRMAVETVDLEEDPYLYGVVLDWLVEDIDRDLAAYYIQKIKEKK